MRNVSDERALWLAKSILPHERALRAWLGRKRFPGLDYDDVVQETYARLASLESIDAIRDARTYMFQVAYSIIMTHLRRSRVVSIRSTGDVEELRVPSLEPTAEEMLESRDELTEIARALTSLPEACRRTFALRRIEGLSQRETAERLGISEKTVEHHMTRSIRLLMDRFGRGGKTMSRASMLTKAGLANAQNTKPQD